MNAFRHILRKELREIWRQPGAVAALVGLAVLIAMALGSGLPRYRSGEAWKAAATRDVREQWATQGARHPHSAAHFGIIAFRPLESTALIEPGVSMFVGQMPPLQTHQRAFPIYPPAEDLTSAARMSPLSPALLSLTLVPLIIILTGYRAISGEREGGNLNLVLASGVSPRALIAGKAAASLTIAGLFWIGLTWVVPGVVDAIVAASEPAPNRVEAHVAAREIQRDLEQRLPSMLEAIYVRHPEWRPSAAAVTAATTPVPGGPASRDSRRVYVPALSASEIAAPFARAAADRRERIERRVRRWSVASPVLAVQALADHLAGTSSDRFVLFERHASALEETWHGFFGPRILRLQEMTCADMDRVPAIAAFAARPTVSGMAWPGAGLLTAVVAAAIMLRQSRRALHG